MTESKEGSTSRSTIKFTYGDLGGAAGMARAVHDKYGRQCGHDQLAAELGMTTSSGAFRSKLSTARTFGIFSSKRGPVVELTDLGLRIVDPGRSDAAKVEAFLNVPLNRSLYEQHMGGVLPGDAGLEEEMVNLGVTRKSVSKARQAFQRSAEYAGFFLQGRNRLVMPPATSGPSPTVENDDPEEMPDEPAPSDRHVGTKPEVHPLLAGLWASLPGQGEQFSPGEQEDWIEMAKLALKMVYGGDREPDPSA